MTRLIPFSDGLRTSMQSNRVANIGYLQNARMRYLSVMSSGHSERSEMQGYVAKPTSPDQLMNRESCVFLSIQFIILSGLLRNSRRLNK